MRTALIILMVAIALASVDAAHAADALTAGDLRWLGSNLNLAGDSPALIDLTEAQQARLHAMIGQTRTGDDRKRQNVVMFLTGVVGGSIEHALEEARQPAEANEVGALGKR